MNKSETSFIVGLIVGLIFLICGGIWASVVDLSELTPYSYTGIVVDKWHTESCTPVMDDEGGYIGENCDDIYVLVANLDEYGRLEKQISYPKFKDTPIDSKIQYSFDEGKLGWTHNKKLTVLQ